MESNKASVSLIAVGDIMLGDHPVCIGHGVRSTIEKKGFDFITNEIADKVGSADVAFGNLESVLSDDGYDPELLASSELRGRPVYASNLAGVGFNLLNVANNHAMQHGLGAFDETVELLLSKSIDVIGLASNSESNVVIKEINGIKIAFVGYSLRPEKYCKTSPPYALSNKDKIIKHVKSVVKSFDGSVVVSLHWGEEYLNYPSTDQMLFARQLVDEGVALILGHHSHVLQGVEEYKEGVIVYSLGNFIFDKWQKNPRETVLFSCEFSEDGISDYSYEPVYIERSLKLTIAKGRIKKRILSNINRYNEALAKVFDEGNGLGSVDQYKKAAHSAYQKFRMQSYLYFIMHIYKYDPGSIASSALRFVRRRIGIE